MRDCQYEREAKRLLREKGIQAVKDKALAVQRKNISPEKRSRHLKILSSVVQGAMEHDVIG
jgi:hypothetical protein